MDEKSKAQGKLLYEKTDFLLKYSIYIAAAVLMFVMIITVCDVVGRYVFGHPITGTAEFSAMTMVLYGYFGMAYGLKYGKLVRMTTLYDKLPAKFKPYMDILIVLIMVAFMTVFVYSTLTMFIQSYQRRETMDAAVTLYAWYGKGCLFLGALLMWVQCILTFISAIQIVVQKREGISVLK